MITPAESRSAADEEPDSTLADLIDRLVARLQGGECLDLEACLREYPQHAGQLKELLPAVLALRAAPLPAAPRPLDGQRLGEYLLLRELGRGGMGVVYEAVQESLGRHVALKVLPQTMARPETLERFQREAKAAARLHHTNIVPVFGIGEHGGVHFYAMQYIKGRGLNNVLHERRDRRSRPAPASAGEAAMATPATGPSGEPSTVCSSTEAAPTTPAAKVHAATSLPGAPPTQITTTERGPYWREVAHLGVQAAEALAYAHRQGILHRDIKPSNLLLDEAGALWIADFGLAKIEGLDDLTGSGDVVGTLRYMAPERFAGRVDARSDVYSLGLTLYELAVERPAYDEPDRLKLIEGISQGAGPPRPRQLVSALPRDLETIILKASDREPSRRYSSAEELADDLRRFLADQPILARRVGIVERCLKQIRRRPLIAGLSAALLVASLTALGVFVWSYIQLGQTNEELEAKTRAEAAATAKLREEKARLLAEVYKSTFNENEALLLARGPGWRQRALDNVKAMTRLDTPRDPVALVRQASDCLTGIDVVPQAKLEKRRVQMVAFSPDSKTVYVTSDGRILALDARTGEPREPFQKLRDKDGPEETVLKGLWCHPRGHYLVSATYPPKLHFFAGPANIPPSDGLLKVGAAQWLAFDRHGDRLAVRDKGGLTIYDADGVTLHKMPVKAENLPVALHPSGRAFVVARGGLQTFIVGNESPKGAEINVAPAGERALQFSPDGNLLAAGLADGSVLLWSVNLSSSGPLAMWGDPLRGHAGRVAALAFAADGRYLATAGQDRTVCLWDPWARRLLVRWDADCGPLNTLAFSPDGQTLAVGGDAGLRPFSLHAWRGVRQLILANSGWPVAFHPKEPWLASPAFGVGIGLYLWDLDGLQLLNEWAAPMGVDSPLLWFSPQGDCLVAHVRTPRGARPPADKGLTFWDTKTGKPQAPIVKDNPDALAFHPDGQFLAWAAYDRVVLWDRVKGAEVWSFATDKTAVVDVVTFCPDTSQVVIGTSTARRFVFLDPATGKEVRRAELPVDQSSPLVVAPAGRRLASQAGPQEISLWEFPSMKWLAVLEAPTADGPVLALALSAGGRYLAIQQRNNRVTVWQTETRRLVVTLAIEANPAGQMVFSPDEKYLACVDAGNRLSLYDLPALHAEMGGLGIK